MVSFFTGEDRSPVMPMVSLAVAQSKKSQIGIDGTRM